MRARGLWLLALPLMIAACQPGEAPPQEETGNGTVRNVIARLVEPQELSVEIKLPVVIVPDEEYELRASSAGKIISLPYPEGSEVPASQLPKGEWLEEAEFLALNPEATEDQVVLRNIRHLDGYAGFAHIEQKQLRQNLREAQANYDQAVRDLKRTEEYPQSTGAQLDAARTRKATTRAQVNRVIAMIEDTYVTNPRASVLTELIRKEGEYVNPGELIAKVAVLDKLIAELEIPEAHRQQLKVGDELEVTIGSVENADGTPVKRIGEIIRIERVAHPTTHSFTVEIEIPNPELTLSAGVFGTTYVRIYHKEDALVVPLSAINLVSEEKSLFVLDESGNTVSEIKNVTLGQMNYRWVEILSPDIRGKRVVTFGAQNLTDGDSVNATSKDPYMIEPGKRGES